MNQMWFYCYCFLSLKLNFNVVEALFNKIFPKKSMWIWESLPIDFSPKDWSSLKLLKRVIKAANWHQLKRFSFGDSDPNYPVLCMYPQQCSWTRSWTHYIYCYLKPTDDDEKDCRIFEVLGCAAYFEVTFQRGVVKSFRTHKSLPDSDCHWLPPGKSPTETLIWLNKIAIEEDTK